MAAAIDRLAASIEKLAEEIYALPVGETNGSPARIRSGEPAKYRDGNAEVAM